MSCLSYKISFYLFIGESQKSFSSFFLSSADPLRLHRAKETRIFIEQGRIVHRSIIENFKKYKIVKGEKGLIDR